MIAMLLKLLLNDGKQREEALAENVAVGTPFHAAKLALPAYPVQVVLGTVVLYN